MYAGKVELCGVDTARLPVLSEAEKSRLIKAARAGDRQARQEMVQGNLRLVLSVVQRFAGRGENMDDLFQVGCIGLIKPSTTLTRRRTCGSRPTALPMIVGEVKRYLRDNNAVRVSRSIRDLAYHSMQAREELQKQNGRERSSPKSPPGSARARRMSLWRWNRCDATSCMSRSTPTARTALPFWISCATPQARKAGSAT